MTDYEITVAADRAADAGREEPLDGPPAPPACVRSRTGVHACPCPECTAYRVDVAVNPRLLNTDIGF